MLFERRENGGGWDSVLGSRDGFSVRILGMGSRDGF